MSVRGDILDQLDAVLNALGGTGYNYDKVTVQRRAFSSEDIDKSESPAIAICDDGREIPLSPVGSDRRTLATIRLDGLAKHQSSSPSPASLSQNCNDFIADVRKCIHASDLGANVIFHRLGELTVVTGENKIGFTYDLEILYYYPEANP